jgi:hypothetical protein
MLNTWWSSAPRVMGMSTGGNFRVKSAKVSGGTTAILSFKMAAKVSIFHNICEKRLYKGKGASVNNFIIL